MNLQSINDEQLESLLTRMTNVVEEIHTRVIQQGQMLEMLKERIQRQDALIHQLALHVNALRNGRIVCE